MIKVLFEKELHKIKINFLSDGEIEIIRLNTYNPTSYLECKDTKKLYEAMKEYYDEKIQKETSSRGS